MKVPSTCPPQSWCLRGARGFLLSVCLSLLCSRVSQSTGFWARRGAKEVGTPFMLGARAGEEGIQAGQGMRSPGPSNLSGKNLGGGL